MPEIEYAFLADAAEVQPGSKFYVLGGGVSRLNGSSLPFVHPHMSLVVGLRLTSVERDREYDLGFIMTAPDGTQVTTATGKVVAHGPADASDLVITIAIDLWNMTLKSAGEHSVRITVDGSERKRLPLMVSVAREPVVQEPQRYLA
jgi:hypothetical protein